MLNLEGNAVSLLHNKLFSGKQTLSFELLKSLHLYEIHFILISYFPLRPVIM